MFFEAILAEASREPKRVGAVATETRVDDHDVERIGHVVDDNLGLGQRRSRDDYSSKSVYLGEGLDDARIILQQEDARKGGHISAHRRLEDRAREDEDGEHDEGVAETVGQLRHHGCHLFVHLVLVHGPGVEVEIVPGGANGESGGGGTVRGVVILVGPHCRDSPDLLGVVAWVPRVTAVKLRLHFDDERRCAVLT